MKIENNTTYMKKIVIIKPNNMLEGIWYIVGMR